MSQSGPVTLTEPKAKRCRLPVQQAFPIPLASLTSQPASQDLWQWYHGNLVISKEQGLDSAHVLIEDGEAANTVYSNGYYGLLNCKDEGETFNRRKEEVKLVEKQWTPGIDFQVEKDDEIDWLEGDESIRNYNQDQELEHEVNLDCDNFLGDKLNKPANKESEPSGCWGDLKKLNPMDQDSLRLELCESFFLSWALGCLLVSNDGEQMNLANMWKEFSRIEPDFIWRYAVYHHFRAKGWVVRSGQKFGVDWLLYKHGPPHYHASYSVRVEVESNPGNSTSNSTIASNRGKPTSLHIPPSTWLSLAGLTRVCQTTGKELLVAQVEGVALLTAADLSSPNCLRKLAITELRVRPWVPAIERWDHKPAVPVLPKKQTGFRPITAKKQASFKQNRTEMGGLHQELRKRKQPPWHYN